MNKRVRDTEQPDTRRDKCVMIYACGLHDVNVQAVRSLATPASETKTKPRGHDDAGCVVCRFQSGAELLRFRFNLALW